MRSEPVSRLGAVIVNYKTPGLVFKCVESILRFNVCDAGDVVVVDNCSPDDSFAQLSSALPAGVRLIASSRNGGFSAGINLGAAQIDSTYLLVLNPDTYFIDTSVNSALSALDADGSIGLLGLDLRYPDGECQFSARRFYSVLDVLARRTPIGKVRAVQRSVVDRHLMKSAWLAGNMFDADWVMGTGFIVRSDLFRRLQGMDEGYFLYMEDVDVCARVWQAGHRVVCLPGAVLIHDHQRSSGGNPFGWAGREHMKSLRRFHNKFGLPLLRHSGIGGLKRPLAGAQNQ